jgi:hypothetical protein
MRGSPRDIELAVHEAAEALAAAGLRASPDPSGRGDLLVTIDDRVFAIEVKSAAYVTPERARRLLEQGPADSIVLVVADRISESATELLRDAGWGWLDAKGRLSLRAPGVVVLTEVPPPPRSPARGGVIGRRGRVVAYRLLTRPDEKISTTRSELGLAPSSVSEAMRDLRAAGLITERGAPVLPELFWEMAGAWVSERAWLGTRPDSNEARRRGPHEAEWKLSGTKAAAALGAPVVAGRETPLDLYVPGPIALNIAARRYRAADPVAAVASVASAPVSEVTTTPSTLHVEGWPVSHLVAVALDLAQDQGRGREILESWEHPDRVW